MFISRNVEATYGGLKRKQVWGKSRYDNTTPGVMGGFSTCNLYSLLLYYLCNRKTSHDSDPDRGIDYYHHRLQHRAHASIR